VIWLNQIGMREAEPQSGVGVMSGALIRPIAREKLHLALISHQFSAPFIVFRVDALEIDS
jgi:hypothetical protein